MAVFFVVLAYQAPAQEVVGDKNGLLADQSTFEMDHVSVKVLGTGGNPVFLIPGLSSPRATWDGIAPELAKTHLVYLVQVNGFGGEAPGANLKPGILTGIVADLDDLLATESSPMSLLSVIPWEESRDSCSRHDIRRA
jgi:pimeloyl-ACP methyl ester carboxylesterase